jgi:hypothetical protein
MPSIFIVPTVLLMLAVVVGAVLLVMALGVLGLGCLPWWSGWFILILRHTPLFTFNYLVQFSTIQPNPTAVWAIINFYALPVRHEQINIGKYRTFHVLTPSWLLAVVTLQRQRQVTKSWLTHHLAEESNPTILNREIVLNSRTSLAVPNLDAAAEVESFREMGRIEGSRLKWREGFRKGTYSCLESIVQVRVSGALIALCYLELGLDVTSC